MDVELITPFVKAARDVVEMMAFTPVQVGECALRNERSAYGAVSGIMGLASEKLQGGLVLSFDEPSILEIVGKMLGMAYTEINDEVVDAVGEITNMVTGAAKRDFSERGVVFDMSIPLVIRGRELDITQLTKGPILSVPFKVEKGSFVVEASLTNRTSR